MIEWLTTGQMIDRLKVGEKAEGFFVMNNDLGQENAIKRIEVVKNDAHSIMEIKTWKVFEITGITISYKWRILPKYVSFEEAMKALKDGKRVNFLANNNYEYKIVPAMHFSALSNDKICWRDLLDGRWTIEE